MSTRLFVPLGSATSENTFFPTSANLLPRSLELRVQSSQAHVLVQDQSPEESSAQDRCQVHCCDPKDTGQHAGGSFLQFLREVREGGQDDLIEAAVC